jgi:hypothetical protein
MCEIDGWLSRVARQALAEHKATHIPQVSLARSPFLSHDKGNFSALKDDTLFSLPR